jgi:hypothetical protein
MTNTSTTVVTVTFDQYKPTFDPDTGKYKDENPFIKNSREKKPPITCPCKCGTFITSYGKFTQHSGSVCHREWVENFGEQQKLENEKRDDKIKLQIEKEKNRKLTIKNGRLQNTNTLHEKKYSDLEHRLSNKINKKNLQITELNDIIREKNLQISVLNETVRELTDINDDKDLIISELRNTLQTQDNYLDALSE